MLALLILLTASAMWGLVFWVVCQFFGMGLLDVETYSQMVVGVLWWWAGMALGVGLGYGLFRGIDKIAALRGGA